MEKILIQEFNLIGLKLHKKTTNENGQSSIDCGNLWQKFEQENIAESIPHKSSNEVFAVYFDYEGDHMSPFSYFIGCKVEPGTPVPDNLQSLKIPEQHYKKVPAKGKMPDCISAAWKEIWNSDYNRTFGFDFEIYDERSHDWSNAQVDIYISTV